MMQILRNYPAYRRLLYSSITAKFGNSITLVVLMYTIAYTNKPIYISLVLLAEMLPMILFGLFAGAIADKYARYKVMISSEWIQTLTVLCMIFSLNNPLLLIALIFLQNIAATFFLPARSAFVSEIVPKEVLGEAIGLSQSIYQAVAIIGPAVTGVLLLFLKSNHILILNAVTFLLSTVFIYLAFKATTPAPSEHKKTIVSESLLQSIQIGLNSTFKIPPLRYLLVLLGLVMLAAGIFNANSEIIIIQLFKVSGFHYGLIGAMMGVGGIIGSLLGPIFIKKFAPNKFFISATVLLGMWMMIIVPSYLYGDHLQLFLLYIWVISIGILNAFLNIPISSIFLAITPNDLKGRAISILQTIANLAVVFGILIGGILASFFDILTVTALAGLATIIAAIISMSMKGFKSLA